MIKEGKEKRPKCAMMQGDAKDSMTFERGSYTHILCMGKTIYEFADKVAFFRNCAHWLIPGGYLVVHLVDPKKFDTVVPLGKTLAGGYGNPSGKNRLYDSPQEFSKSRTTNTMVDFIDFKYKSAYDFDQLDKTGQVVQVETFTDTGSSHVRQNEHTMYMEPERDLLAKAQFAGFVLAGKFTMERYDSDPYQTVYILQRM
jgi:SAM-dependent methyltransferase